MTNCSSFCIRLPSLTFALPLLHAYSYAGLVSFWVGRELDEKEWIARGVECKEEIEKLAASASKWNFQNSEYGV